MGFRRLSLPGFLDNRHMKVQGCHFYAPTAFTPRRYSLYSVLLEDGRTPGKGRIMSVKNLVTPFEIEPFRLAAQCLNQLHHSAPHLFLDGDNSYCFLCLLKMCALNTSVQYVLLLLLRFKEEGDLYGKAHSFHIVRRPGH